MNNYFTHEELREMLAEDEGDNPSTIATHVVKNLGPNFSAEKFNHTAETKQQGYMPGHTNITHIMGPHTDPKNPKPEVHAILSTGPDGKTNVSGGEHLNPWADKSTPVKNGNEAMAAVKQHVDAHQAAQEQSRKLNKGM